MMQLNVLKKLKPLIEEKRYDLDIDSLSKILSKYRSNEWIYPNAIYNQCKKINIKQVYEILEFLVKKGLLKTYLQIHCPICHKLTGRKYASILEIPADILCVHCDEEIIHPINYAIIIYTVI